MNIHFFMDPLGYYSGHFASELERLSLNDNVIVNINLAKIKHAKIIYFDGYKKPLKKWVTKIDKADRVYFHYHNPIFQELNIFFRKKFPAVTSIWTFWGGDFYALPEFIQNRYFEFSKKEMTSTTISRKNIFRQIGVELYYRAKGLVPYNHKRFIASINQFDYLAIYFKTDFDNVVKYSKSSVKFFKFSYVSISSILGDVMNWNNYELGAKIMVGHSADPGLNHFEILEKLNQLNCKKTILLPMHYGDGGYKSKLLNATSQFNLTTELLDIYLPLNDYNKKLLEVSCAIFNVNHQQAFGNIITLIWLGVKVFLHKESAIYIEFKEAGVTVFSISDIQNLSDLEKLTIPEIEQNRKVLTSLLSNEVVENMTKELITLNKAIA